MFRNVSFNFATAISKLDTLSSYHIVRTRIAKVTNFFPFCPIRISMYQKNSLPYFIILYFLTPSFFPFKPSQTDGQRNFNTPFTLTSFFFPLSAWGSTRRRNSTGLAELLWGGWPIELGLAGNVASADYLADRPPTSRHKFVPDTFFCVGDCRLSPNFLHVPEYVCTHNLPKTSTYDVGLSCQQYTIEQLLTTTTHNNQHEPCRPTLHRL